MDFSGSQGEIPALQFTLINTSGKLLLDSVSNDSSGNIADFTTALILRDSILHPDSIVAETEFRVYDDANTSDGTQEPVSDHLRNSDILQKLLRVS